MKGLDGVTKFIYSANKAFLLWLVLHIVTCTINFRISPCSNCQFVQLIPPNFFHQTFSYILLYTYLKV